MVYRCTVHQQDTPIPVGDLSRAGYSERVTDDENWMCTPGIPLLDSGPYDAAGEHSLPARPILCLKVLQFREPPVNMWWGP